MSICGLYGGSDPSHRMVRGPPDLRLVAVLAAFVVAGMAVGSTFPFATSQARNPATGTDLPASDAVPADSDEATALASGGPETFEYRLVDSDDPDGPDFRYIDIGDPAFPDEAYMLTGEDPDRELLRVENRVANETDDHPWRFVLGDDSVGDYTSSWPVDLGFTFEFYGEPHDHIFIHSMGLVTFEDYRGRAYELLISDIPFEKAPNNYVAAFHTGLDLPDQLAPNQQGDILARTVGPPGDRVFVVEFLEVPQLDEQMEEYVSFQIQLFETDNSIEVHYLDVDPAYDPDTGVGWPRTGGIENHNGTVGLEYFHDQRFHAERLAVRYFLVE